MLNREFAPITNKAWNEIDERATEVLKSYLSARKVVKVNGPFGLDFNVVTEGRLNNIVDEGELCYSNYKVLPLTESRVEFEMDRWELDNLDRGAKDVDYEPLEKAAERIALFEENAIYNGLNKALIVGLKNSVTNKTIPFGIDLVNIMEAITLGLIKLHESYQSGSFDLIVGEKIYKRILSTNSSYPLEERIKELIGGKIIYNHVIDEAYLLPHDHEDLELTIGQDFAIGYTSHTDKSMKFFITESFTFRVLDSSLIIKYDVN